MQEGAWGVLRCPNEYPLSCSLFLALVSYKIRYAVNNKCTEFNLFLIHSFLTKLDVYLIEENPFLQLLDSKNSGGENLLQACSKVYTV